MGHGIAQACAAAGRHVFLYEPERARALGQAGARAVFERFSSQSMASGCLRVFEEVRSPLAQAQALEMTGTGIGQPARDLQTH